MRDLTTTLETVTFNIIMLSTMATNCELDDAVAEDFIEKNKAANTVRKTKSDLNVWYRWCAGVNESRKLEELTPSELYSIHVIVILFLGTAVFK